MNLSQVILKPVLTEKSVNGETSSKYTFFVHADATKVDVKLAIKSLFGVSPQDVNILKRRAKYRMGKNRMPMQKREDSRKAIITLKKGEKLNVTKIKV